MQTADDTLCHLNEAACCAPLSFLEESRPLSPSSSTMRRTTTTATGQRPRLRPTLFGNYSSSGTVRKTGGISQRISLVFGLLSFLPFNATTTNLSQDIYIYTQIFRYLSRRGALFLRCFAKHRKLFCFVKPRLPLEDRIPLKNLVRYIYTRNVVNRRATTPTEEPRYQAQFSLAQSTSISPPI